MQQLNITDPMAVDAALAPSLEALEFAVRDHAASKSQSPTCGSIAIKDSGCNAFPALRQAGKPSTEVLRRSLKVPLQRQWRLP